MKEKTPLLVVGAGPFGLSLAAYLKQNNVEHLHIGRSMDYWREHMPHKMLLRSACDWHLDALNEATILKYLDLQNLGVKDVEPITLEFYLGYAQWFQQQKGLAPLPTWIQKIRRAENSFIAETADGEIEAEKIVLAVGLRYFKNIPEEYEKMIPRKRSNHTAEFVDFSSLENKKVLIIGGRQSAFEWAALMHAEGAKEVHLAYRHDTPTFTTSEWGWVNSLMEEMVNQPEWFRNLTQDEKDRISKRLWTEGRLKLEPWLANRIAQAAIHMHPHTTVSDCKELSSGEMLIELSSGMNLGIDHILFATGYKMDINRMSILGNLANEMEIKNGFPVLDLNFQSSIPNLYFTGFPAAQDFGPFFGFTAAVRTSTRIIGKNFL